ncbi:MAG: hypothetical protein QNJ57_09545 [Flavobacteriaceae bacterium]|nr:hypothetical protein [Flavobacteriaceae bacterium]
MIKVFSILVSGLILIQSLQIDLSDIARLDDLVKHANMHSKKYGDNFLTFISKHYGELKLDHSKKHKEEQKDHERLPFDHQSGSQYSGITFVLMPTHKELVKPETILNTTVSFYYQETNSLFEKSKIFQPPKQA